MVPKLKGKPLVLSFQSRITSFHLGENSVHSPNWVLF